MNRDSKPTVIITVTRESFCEPNLLGREIRGRAFKETQCGVIYIFNRLYLKTNGNYALTNRLCELRKLSGEVAEKLREKTAEDMRLASSTTPSN
jgi:hypothetical protein